MNWFLKAFLQEAAKTCYFDCKQSGIDFIDTTAWIYERDKKNTSWSLDRIDEKLAKSEHTTSEF